MKKKTNLVSACKYLVPAAALVFMVGCKSAPKEEAVVTEETEVVAVEEVPATAPVEVATTPEESVSETPAVPESHVFDAVEEMPQFPGGQEALMKYLQKNIKYPVIAKENDKQGRVIVQFVVDKTGKVTDVTVARGVDPLLDAEAVRIVSEMPNWTPGKQNGDPVNVKYTVPVVFKLS